MLSLLFRASQAQSSCHCKTCLHAAHGVARRSATAASRRKVTAADLFTACYTTILGTAVVLDAKRKDVRRKDLDEKLERARASMSSLAIQEAPANHDICTEHGAWNISTNDYSNYNVNIDAAEAKDTEGLLEELRQLAAATYKTRSRSSWLQYQIDWVQVEAAIAAEERNPDIALRHPQNDEQMERTTRMVENLVKRLLGLSRKHHNGERVITGPTDELKEERLLEEVEELGKSFPSYASPHADPFAATEGRTLLNESFRRIFNKAATDTEIVGKICYNLLLSSTAPNIHNYNALIAGFNRIQRPDLAQVVVDSYLDDVKWPATQQTIICLLDHARGTNNLKSFREVVGRMRGTIEDGLHLRIFHKGAISNEPGMHWVQRYATIRKHAYVERAPRGNEVFNSLIRGWLHFGKVDIASMSFVACLRNGRVIPVETIQELLTECLATLDQQTARAMLKGLAIHVQNFEALVEYILAESSDQVARRIADMFYALFDLCATSYQPVLGSVRKSLRDLVDAFRNIHLANHTKLQTRETAESSYDFIERNGSSEPLELERSHFPLGSIDTKSLANSQARREFKSIATLASLTKRYQVLEERAKRIDAHAKVFILKSQTGYDIDPESCLPPIDWQHRRGDDNYPALFYALQSIQIGRGPVTLDDVKVQLILNVPDKHRAEKLAKKFIGSGSLETLRLQPFLSFYDPRPKPFERLSLQPKARNHSEIGEIEERISEAEDATKNILFCHLGKARQRKLMHTYIKWQDIPLAEIFRCQHMALAHRIGVVRRHGPGRLEPTRKVEILEESPMNIAASHELPWETRVASPPQRYADMTVVSVSRQRILEPDERPLFPSVQFNGSALY